MRIFWAKVDSYCPNASAINRTNEFNAFMDTTDPVTGLSYMQLGGAAMMDKNAQAVAKIVQAYKKLTGADDDIDGQVQTQIKPESSTATVFTEEEVAGIPVYRSDILQFYKDCRGMEVYGPDPENHPDSKKMMEAIERAVMEGRVVEDVQ